MPTIEELDLPLRRVKITGPAVDALETRKEQGYTTVMTAGILIAQFEAIRPELTRSLLKLNAIPLTSP